MLSARYLGLICASRQTDGTRSWDRSREKTNDLGPEPDTLDALDWPKAEFKNER